jgi:polyphosphate kinase
MSTALRKDSLSQSREQTARLPALLPKAAGAARLFFNRELSLLEFHKRVLEEGLDEDNPLLERLKFLAIFSSNLDEFFMIRVSGLKEALEENVTELSLDGMTPNEQLHEIRQRVLPMLQEQIKCLREQLLPQLKAAGLQVVSYDSLRPEDQETLRSYFMEKVFPILTPLAVDQSHPFPYISPLSLNLGLMVEAPPGHSPADPKHKHRARFVRIKVPSLVPRLIPVGKFGTKFVLLEELIEANRD